MVNSCILNENFAAKRSSNAHSIRGNGKFMKLKNIFLFVAGSGFSLEGEEVDCVCCADFDPQAASYQRWKSH